MKRNAFLCTALFALAAFGLQACKKDYPPCPPRTMLVDGNCVLIDKGEATCMPGAALCGEACTFVETDSRHCGACNAACEENQHCAEGTCLACDKASHVYAACLLTGHVAVLSSQSQSRIALELVGNGPQALSGMGEVLLCADNGTQRLLRLDAQTLQPVGTPVHTGEMPMHISKYGPYVYVVNAGSGTLQIVDTQNKPGSRWETVGEWYFGPNTFPQAFASTGDYGFVPLYGNLAEGESEAGQRLVRMDLSTPQRPARSGEVDFTPLDLRSYPGKSALPLPYDVVHHQGALYVALNNLDRSWQVAGPGAVAKVEVKDASTSVLFLGDTCQNVSALASNGNLLVASCAGDFGWTPGIAGLALIEGDEVKEVWPAPAGFSPGKMAFACDTLWVANANGGDVYLFSTQGKSLQLLRGEGGSEGGPLETCPQAATGFSVVQSLWLKP